MYIGSLNSQVYYSVKSRISMMQRNLLSLKNIIIATKFEQSSATELLLVIRKFRL